MLGSTNHKTPKTISKTGVWVDVMKIWERDVVMCDEERVMKRE